ncbi:hypothetical protein ES332_A05G464600v1 [Gossypium tomentosum]|uniref:Uncharacterized protein n=1 Tax=Gossypium tomentosum TaxID=34277 RepID=A0A5D2QTY3_GOSTO|nr:hypothetical protein ES332_A05G464600v1 [Gossypium tomentosum]
MLWKIRRNAMVFSEEFTDASSFFARCIWYKDETRLESSSLGNQVWRDISWSAPPMGVSKVNVDGAYSAGTSRTLLLVLGCGALHATLVVAISIKRAVGCA